MLGEQEEIRENANEGGKNFLNYCLTTDMQNTDIVFGGEKKIKTSH